MIRFGIVGMYFNSTTVNQVLWMVAACHQHYYYILHFFAPRLRSRTIPSNWLYRSMVFYLTLRVAVPCP